MPEAALAVVNRRNPISAVPHCQVQVAAPLAAAAAGLTLRNTKREG